MICFVNLARNDVGKVIYVACPKVVLAAKAYDLEVDGLPPHLKARVQKILGALKKYLGVP